LGGGDGPGAQSRRRRDQKTPWLQGSVREKKKVSKRKRKKLERKTAQEAKQKGQEDNLSLFFEELCWKNAIKIKKKKFGRTAKGGPEVERGRNLKRFPGTLRKEKGEIRKPV